MRSRAFWIPLSVVMLLSAPIPFAAMGSTSKTPFKATGAGPAATKAPGEIVPMDGLWIEGTPGARRLWFEVAKQGSVVRNLVVNPKPGSGGSQEFKGEFPITDGKFTAGNPKAGCVEGKFVSATLAQGHASTANVAEGPSGETAERAALNIGFDWKARPDSQESKVKEDTAGTTGNSQADSESQAGGKRLPQAGRWKSTPGDKISVEFSVAPGGKRITGLHVSFKFSSQGATIEGYENELESVPVLNGGFRGLGGRLKGTFSSPNEARGSFEIVHKTAGVRFSGMWAAQGPPVRPGAPATTPTENKEKDRGSAGGPDDPRNAEQKRLKQQEEALDAQIDLARFAEKEGNLKEALEQYKRLAASFPADMVGKRVNVQAKVADLESKMAAAPPAVDPTKEPLAKPKPVTSADINKEVADICDQATALEKQEKFEQARLNLEEILRSYAEKYWPENLKGRILRLKASEEALKFFGNSNGKK